MQDSIHLPTLNKDAPESVVFMLMDVENVAEEEVDVSMEEVVVEDMEEEVDEVEEETVKEVVEEAAAHMKMKLTSRMSPVTSKIQIGPHSQTT